MNTGKNYPGQIAPNGTELSEDPLKDMVRLEPGKFRSMDGKSEIALTKPFWIAKYQVTRRLHRLAMNGTHEGLGKLEKFGCPGATFGHGFPAEQLEAFGKFSLEEHYDMPHVFSASMKGRREAEVFDFLDRLNEFYRDRLPEGYCFGMPTEAQWEYAFCQGGNQADDADGSLEPIAWTRQNSGWVCHPVGRKQPNGLGICDMLGNVWEICSDFESGAAEIADPLGNVPDSPQACRIAKGGSCFWGYDGVTGGSNHSTSTNFYDRTTDYGTIGLRLAVIPCEQAAKVAEIQEAFMDLKDGKKRRLGKLRDFLGKHFTPEQVEKLIYDCLSPRDFNEYESDLREKVAQGLPFKEVEECIMGGLDLGSSSELDFSRELAEMEEQKRLKGASAE